ncbi:MAG: hypothetical protein QOE11_594 [Solirubrobacteraceae bacterium]|nr:hypothetical protein [Solirubrobacteraceae bacterium]
MAEVLYYAVPAFVLLLAVEAISFQVARNEALVGYDTKDTAASLSMGIGNVVIDFAWKFVVLLVYAGLYELTPLRIPTDAWWAWVIIFFADDLAYYWFHRISHEVRGASHVVHHSSRHCDLSTIHTERIGRLWQPIEFPFNTPPHHRVHHGANEQ